MGNLFTGIPIRRVDLIIKMAGRSGGLHLPIVRRTSGFKAVLRPVLGNPVLPLCSCRAVFLWGTSFLLYS